MDDDVVAVKRGFLTDFGLAAFLIGMTLWSIGSAALNGWIENMDLLVYTGATAVLVVNTLRRPPAVTQDSRWWVWLLCVVSTLSFALYDGNTPLWLAIVAVHMAGDFCLIYLGSSFSIMPARRTIKRGMMYRFVRHPVYASYAVTDVLFVSQEPSLRNLLVGFIAIAMYVIRAHLEEKLLHGDPCYQEYCYSTRFRFLPGIY